MPTHFGSVIPPLTPVQKMIGATLLIDKPSGMTSFDIIRVLRKKLNFKKMGHAGTLDPMATGLMIIGIGKATKKLTNYIKSDKEYEGTIELGKNSDTYDGDGAITSVPNAVEVSEEAMEEILESFTGEIEQVPPIYSAKKIKGVPAYKLARKGEEVKLEPRKVKIYDIEILNYVWPFLSLRVKCSSGTYIRSLAHDLGEKLRCGAYLKELRRTKVGDFDVKDAYPI